MILILYEDVSSSKRKFSKSQALWAGTYKNIFDQPRQMEWSQFSLKNLVLNFGNSIIDNSNWDKISEGILKNSVSGTE